MKFIKVAFFFAIFSSLLVAFPIETREFSDDFNSIDNYKIKKEEFIKLLLPIVEYQNTQIQKERDFIKNFFSKDFFITLDKKMDRDVLQKLTTIAKKYNVKNLFDKKEYLKRIDTIPISMALAQAALESGWGNSDYARDLNNIFGHYTFSRNIKAHRVIGKKERIREFDSLDVAVKQYMLNINSHWAYEDFRDKRAYNKANFGYFSGLDGIKHLTRYSEIRGSYIKKLQTLISVNNLLIYDFTPVQIPRKINIIAINSLEY